MLILRNLLARFSIQQESSPAVTSLKSDLKNFYELAVDYTDFHSAVSKDRFWPVMLDHVKSCKSPQCRVLEFGAGRTEFQSRLLDVRSDIEFHTQDITSQNLEFLQSCSARVHISAIFDIKEQFDLIFSTFVWEHIPDPQKTLQHLLSLLKPEGALMIVCPAYDFPGYLSPSAQNRSYGSRLLLAGLLCMARLQSYISKKPQFLIDTKPALFDQPWSRDTDAVHWVSRMDFIFSCTPEFTLKFHRVPDTGHFLDWFWSKFLVVFAEFKRKEVSEN